MKMTSPVTQRDLAEQCGVHPSTICLALRNSPALPEATRLRIQRIAAESGYQPNAAARNLSFLRTEKQAVTSLPLGWINQHERADYWRTDPAGRRLLEAARLRAATLGYYIDEHWLHQPHMSAARLAGILRARGIQGVLLPLHDGACGIDARLWSEFAAIVVNGRLHDTGLDEVCPDHFHNMDLAMARLGTPRGQRFGLALSRSFDSSTGGLARSRFLRGQESVPAEDRIPVCLYERNDDNALAAIIEWQRRHRLDVILGRGLPRRLASLVPSTLELRLDTPAGAQSGIDERPELVAAAAIDQLSGKIRRFETGPSDQAQTLLIRGVWHESAAMTVHAA